MGRTNTQVHADQEGPHSFTGFLERVDDGRAVLELADAQHKLLIACKDQCERSMREAGGELTLKLKYVAREGGQVDVMYGIETKGPKRKTARSTFFLTAGANAQLENPRQTTLPLRDVHDRDDVRDVNDDDDDTREVH